MNDSLRTDIFLRYSQENIVCACIYLAARELKISLPQNPQWFTIFNADEESIQEICIRILHLYSHKTKSQEELEKVVVDCHHQINEEKRKTREEKYKQQAATVAAAITQESAKKSETTKEEASKTDVPLESKIKSKFEDRKFPHQQRGHVSTPPDQQLPVLSHSNPYYVNHHPVSGHMIPAHPMSRHSSFNYPYNYPHPHPHYMNGSGPYPPGVYPEHYQNENYYESGMKRNKSSNDLLPPVPYKDIDDYRHHSYKYEKHRSRDRSHHKAESRDEHSRSKISNQTNKIDFNSRSKSRSRSPWKKEKQSSRKNRGSHKHASRSKSRSLDSIDSDHSRSPSSSKHKKKKTSHHSSSHRKEERSSKDHEKKDRERSHHRHHHKSSKSSKTRSREREASGEPSGKYVPIYS